MNRLPLTGSTQGFETGAVQVAESTIPLLERTPLALAAPHRLFYPKHFEARYKYPLFIWLHSPDSSEYELDELMPAVSTRNYVALGLRGSESSALRECCFRWSLSDSARVIAEETVLATVQLAVQDLPVDSTRVFIGGFGMGGTMAQWIGLRNPAFFSGVMSINGVVPDRPKWLTNWKQAKQTPVLFMYGESSELCSFAHVGRSLEATYRSSLLYQFVQFNCGDCLDTSMTTMMNQFMMAPKVKL